MCYSTKVYNGTDVENDKNMSSGYRVFAYGCAVVIRCRRRRLRRLRRVCPYINRVNVIIR